MELGDAAAMLALILAKPLQLDRAGCEVGGACMEG